MATDKQPGEGAGHPHFVTADEWDAIAKSLRLSNRERQIMRLVLEDHTEARIASSLGLSVHTVHTYLDRLYRKLKVGTRSSAVVKIFMAYVTLRRPGSGQMAPIQPTPESQAP